MGAGRTALRGCDGRDGRVPGRGLVPRRRSAGHQDPPDERTGPVRVRPDSTASASGPPSACVEAQEKAVPRDGLRMGSGEWIRTTDLRVMSPTSYRCSTPRRTHAVYTMRQSSRAIPRSRGDRMALAPAYFPTAKTAISSALERFTAVFGMGTGGTTPLSPPRPSGRRATQAEQASSKKRKWILPARCSERSGREPSAISNGQLHWLPSFHLRPINLVIFQGPYPVNPVGSLIFRRASHLDAFSAYPFRTSATQQCPWRNNWYTGGPSIPVLSY